MTPDLLSAAVAAAAAAAAAVAAFAADLACVPRPLALVWTKQSHALHLKDEHQKVVQQPEPAVCMNHPL